MAEEKKNYGKIFEQEFKNSVPAGYYCYRLRDIPTEFRAVNNPCDFILYSYPYMFMVELKTHKGKSLPFTKIRPNQLEDLYKASQQQGIVGGFLINFRELEETYYLSANAVYGFVNGADRKSIPVEFCREMGIQIPQKKLRVRYRYDLEEWLKRYFV